MKHYHALQRIKDERMLPLGKAFPDWSFKQSEHINSLKHGLHDSLKPCCKLPTMKFTKPMEPTPDWRQQLTEAWKGLKCS